MIWTHKTTPGKMPSTKNMREGRRRGGRKIFDNESVDEEETA